MLIRVKGKDYCIYNDIVRSVVNKNRYYFLTDIIVWYQFLHHYKCVAYANVCNSLCNMCTMLGEIHRILFMKKPMAVRIELDRKTIRLKFSFSVHWWWRLGALHDYNTCFNSHSQSAFYPDVDHFMWLIWRYIAHHAQCFEQPKVLYSHFFVFCNFYKRHELTRQISFCLWCWKWWQSRWRTVPANRAFRQTSGNIFLSCFIIFRC